MRRTYIADVSKTVRLRTVIRADGLEEARKRAAVIARHIDPWRNGKIDVDYKVLNVSEVESGSDDEQTKGDK